MCKYAIELHICISGREIDCLFEHGDRITPIEIKSGKTMTPDYFDNLKYWNQLAGTPEEKGYVVYGGEQSMQTQAGALVSWRDLERIPVE
ncbi:MAG: hypothetical protein IANPNBLG_03509 [Bryobacteraceae bacterium]|nr:hypothetical protein [Bryobacteraceae bacterium]